MSHFDEWFFFFKLFSRKTRGRLIISFPCSFRFYFVKLLNCTSRSSMSVLALLLSVLSSFRVSDCNLPPGAVFRWMCGCFRKRHAEAWTVNHFQCWDASRNSMSISGRLIWLEWEGLREYRWTNFSYSSCHQLLEYQIFTGTLNATTKGIYLMAMKRSWAFLWRLLTRCVKFISVGIRPWGWTCDP